MHAAVQRSGSSGGRRRAHSCAGAAASSASAGNACAAERRPRPARPARRAPSPREPMPGTCGRPRAPTTATTCARGTPVSAQPPVDERGVERDRGAPPTGGRRAPAPPRRWAADAHGERRRRSGMAPGERRGGRAVPPAAGEPRAPGLRLAVVDRAAGVVAGRASRRRAGARRGRRPRRSAAARRTDPPARGVGRRAPRWARRDTRPRGHDAALPRCPCPAASARRQ